MRLCVCGRGRSGLDFFHRVTRPWARDPVFYLPSGHEGPTAEGFSGVMAGGRRGPKLPLSAERAATAERQLRALPLLYEQAIGNLSADIAQCQVGAQTATRCSRTICHAVLTAAFSRSHDMYY